MYVQASNPRDAGAVKERRPCTDLFWAILFGASLIVAGLIFAQGVSEGNPARLYKGINYNAKVCGVTAEVKDKPFLFWPRSPSTGAIDVATPLCVKQCFTEEDAKKGVSVNFPFRTMLVNNATQTMTTTETTILSPVYATTLIANAYCIPADKEDAKFVGKQFTGVFYHMQQAIGSLDEGWPMLLAGFAIAIGLSILFLWVVSHLSSTLVWVFIGIGTLVIFILGSVLLFSGISGEFAVDYFPTNEANNFYCILAGALFLALGVLVLITLLVSREKISVAARLVDAAADCLMDTPSMLLNTLVSSATTGAFLLFWVLGAVWIASAADIVAPETEMNFNSNGGAKIIGMHRHLHFDTWDYVYLAVWNTVCWWAFEWINAFNHFVTSYAATCWYYAHHSFDENNFSYKDMNLNPLRESLKRAITSHLGSFAVGGLVIGLTRPLRFIFGRFGGKARRVAGNAEAYTYDSHSWLGGCIFNYMHNVEQFSNLAWIEMSYSGEDFCDSANVSWGRVMNGPAGVFVLNGMARIFGLVGTVFVGAVTTFVCWLMLTNIETFTSNSSSYHVQEPIAVAISICFLSAFIGGLYMQLLEHTAETCMYMYLMDYRNIMLGGGDFGGHVPPTFLALIQEHDAKAQHLLVLPDMNRFMA